MGLESDNSRIVLRTWQSATSPGDNFWLWMPLAILAAVVACGSLHAQDADAVALVQPAFTDRQFEQWVFQQQSTAIGARKNLNARLTLRTEEINRFCGLSVAQKKKVQLAGRGDIKRFFDRYEKVKQKFQKLKNDQQKFNQIWQDIAPLQITFRFGLFHRDSFLHKSLRNTLNEEQFARYAVVLRDRRRFRHRVQVELAVAMLERGMPLRNEQRQKLIVLVVNETKPPRKSSSQYDYYVVMFQLSRMPEGKLKRLLDKTQWKVLKKQLDQVRGMEQQLRQLGYLTEDGDEDEIDEAKPAVQAQKN